MTFQTKPFETLEVGKTYLNRVLGKEKILNKSEENEAHFSGTSGFLFDANGRLYSHRISRYDLIAEVIEKPVYRVKAGKEQWIKESEYFPNAMTDDELKELTKPDVNYTKDHYRAALDDFINGSTDKQTRDVIKDALRVMGGA